MENSQIAFDDAGHAAMHAKKFDDEQKEMERVAMMTKSAQATFNEAQALVVKLTYQLNFARAEGARHLALYKETMQMVDVQNKKDQVDAGYIMNDQRACEARNEAAKELNKKRMRDAEKTAWFWCDPEEPTRCKWTYDAIVVAKLENCVDMSIGFDHKNLSKQAQEKAQAIKVSIEENDLLVAELGMLLENAQMRTTKAQEALAKFLPKDQSTSSTKSGQ